MEYQVKTEHKPITVALETLGCKLNQAESEQIVREMLEAGYRIVSPSEKADLYILNTCTVTGTADRKSRHLIRMAQRRNPAARIVVLGCYADRASQDLVKMGGISLIAGNEDKLDWRRWLNEPESFKPSEVKASAGHGNRTRSFVKAQDGCNNYCTYCIVPFVRGREKSLPPGRVIREIQQRIKDGYKEIVLTGTEIGRYSSEGADLKTLIECILCETENARLRLSSLQPLEITPDLIRLWENARLCRHFHISLQSGCNSVLQRMGRRYTTEDYARTITYIRKEIPRVAITTDVIVGFPGESEDEFQESLDFCRRMEYSRIHVFTYSPRKGTRAADMKEQITPQLKKQRSREMLALARSSMENYHQRFLGKTEAVLFEQSAGNLWSGYTDTYIRVFVDSQLDLTNRIIPVKLTALKSEGVLGILTENNIVPVEPERKIC